VNNAGTLKKRFILVWFFHEIEEPKDYFENIIYYLYHHKVHHVHKLNYEIRSFVDR
jgi:hypothetical protein